MLSKGVQSPWCPDSHYSFSPMFDLQGDRKITIEQESLGNKEDVEDDDQDEHQKGYRS